MRNTAAVTGGKPFAVLLQSISSVSAINLLVAFYDIHRGKRFFYFVPDTTRDAKLKGCGNNTPLNNNTQCVYLSVLVNRVVKRLRCIAYTVAF
jgi:hypothetical protein